MGRKIIQRIHSCDKCDEIPEDGEPLWEMGTQVICENCIDNENEEEDEPD